MPKMSVIESLKRCWRLRLDIIKLKLVLIASSIIMASYISLSSSNSSNEDISMHLRRLYMSDNSTNIRSANSRRKNRKTEDFDYTQTWHSNLDSALESANSSSTSLLNSQRFSGSKFHHSQDKLQKQLLKRNHNLQQSFTQTCQPMLGSPMVVVSSSDSENSPNSSDLYLEQPHYFTSSPNNSISIQDMPALHFSGSSNESLENRPPSLNYDYGNSM